MAGAFEDALERSVAAQHELLHMFALLQQTWLAEKSSLPYLRRMEKELSTCKNTIERLKNELKQLKVPGPTNLADGERGNCADSSLVLLSQSDAEPTVEIDFEDMAKEIVHTNTVQARSSIELPSFPGEQAPEHRDLVGEQIFNGARRNDDENDTNEQLCRNSTLRSDETSQFDCNSPIGHLLSSPSTPPSSNLVRKRARFIDLSDDSDSMASPRPSSRRRLSSSLVNTKDHLDREKVISTHVVDSITSTISMTSMLPPANQMHGRFSPPSASHDPKNPPNDHFKHHPRNIQNFVGSLAAPIDIQSQDPSEIPFTSPNIDATIPPRNHKSSSRSISPFLAPITAVPRRRPQPVLTEPGFTPPGYWDLHPDD